MQYLIDKSLGGNTVNEYLTALGFFAVLILIVLIIRQITFIRLNKWSIKTHVTLDEKIVVGIRKIVVPLLLYSSFYAAVKSLNLRPDFAKTFHLISAIIFTYFFIRVIVSIFKLMLHSYLRAKGEPELRKKQLSGIISVASFFIWVTGFLFLLDNLGFQISTIIAGLGIGGIAIALAAQAILGDLFNYFVIFLDHPFEIGDFITVDDKRGTVEHIGIKSTRVRSLSGELIVFSNTNLTSSRVHNFKRMVSRRIAFKFILTFQTNCSQLEKVPQYIKEIITSIPDTTFDRSHLFNIGDTGLIFETVYFVNTSDYNKFMDIQQDINIKIIKKFEESGISFSNPAKAFITNDSEKIRTELS